MNLRSLNEINHFANQLSKQIDLNISKPFSHMWDTLPRWILLVIMQPLLAANVPMSGVWPLNFLMWWKSSLLVSVPTISSWHVRSQKSYIWIEKYTIKETCWFSVYIVYIIIHIYDFCGKWGLGCSMLRPGDYLHRNMYMYLFLHLQYVSLTSWKTDGKNVFLYPAMCWLDVFLVKCSVPKMSIKKTVVDTKKIPRLGNNKNTTSPIFI